MTGDVPPEHGPPARRHYASAVRAERAERTRQAILAAFVDQLRDGSEISVPQAAAAAGVSVRTVYHHFADDGARRRALAAHIEAQLSGGSPFGLPADADDLPDLAYRLMMAGAAHIDLVRAQASNGFTHPVRRERLTARRAAIAEVLTAIGAPADVTRRSTAMIHLLMSAEAGLPLIDVHGLSGDEAAHVAAATVRMIVDDLRRQAAR